MNIKQKILIMELIDYFDRYGKTPDSMYFSSELQELFQISQRDYISFLYETDRINSEQYSNLLILIEPDTK
jgi:phage antirepressor YoqD-like protein